MWKLLLPGCVTCVLDCIGWSYFWLKLINRIKWKHARDENVNQGLNSIEVGQHREKPWVRPPRTLSTELLFILILTRAFGNDAKCSNCRAWFSSRQNQRRWKTILCYYTFPIPWLECFCYRRKSRKIYYETLQNYDEGKWSFWTWILWVMRHDLWIR